MEGWRLLIRILICSVSVDDPDFAVFHLWMDGIRCWLCAKELEVYFYHVARLSLIHEQLQQKINEYSCRYRDDTDSTAAAPDYIFFWIFLCSAPVVLALSFLQSLWQHRVPALLVGPVHLIASHIRVQTQTCSHTHYVTDTE